MRPVISSSTQFHISCNDCRWKQLCFYSLFPRGFLTNKRKAGRIMHENTCCLWNSDINTTSKAVHEYCTPKKAFFNKAVDKVTLKDQAVDIIQSTNPVKIQTDIKLNHALICLQSFVQHWWTEWRVFSSLLIRALYLSPVWRVPVAENAIKPWKKCTFMIYFICCLQCK